MAVIKTATEHAFRIIDWPSGRLSPLIIAWQGAPRQGADLTSPHLIAPFYFLESC